MSSANRTSQDVASGLAIIRELRSREVVRRDMLIKQLGLSRKRVDTMLDVLLEGGVIQEGRDRVRHGHKLSEIRLTPELGYVVGVDVTLSQAEVAVADLGYCVKASAKIAIPIEDRTETLRAIATCIADLLDKSLDPTDVSDRLIGVAVTLPGPICRQQNPTPQEDRKEAADWDRLVRADRILPSWDDDEAQLSVAAELASLLKAEFNICPPRHRERRIVWLENDASAGALGVYTAARLARGDEAPDDIVYLRVTAGLGGGIINKGHLINGSRGYAGELGHVTVDPDGALCPSCGGRGCLETVASNRALVRQLLDFVPRGALPRSQDENQMTMRERIDMQLRMLLEGRHPAVGGRHPAVERALWDAGWHVGTVLASVCCVLNPRMIVMHGKACDHQSYHDPATKPYVDGAETAIRHSAMPQLQEELEVRTWTELQEDYGRVAPQVVSLEPELLGALALVTDHLGDGYLLRPIERWLSAGGKRREAVDFRDSALVPA